LVKAAHDREQALRQTNEALRGREEDYQTLREEYQKLQRKLFGTSSEKLPWENVRQLGLFNEAEAGATPSPEPVSTITIAEHQRAKPGRRPISKDLPREIVVHDLTPQEKQCPCCGQDRPLVGEETTEEVDIIPAQVKVIQHIRKVYGPCRCKDFENSGKPPMERAAMPPRMIHGSIASSGMLAYVVTAKYADGLPLYRQEQIFVRLGVDVPRATLCNWVIEAAARCGPLIDLMWELARAAPFHNMDESPLQVLKEPGRPATSGSYMWVNVAHLETEDDRDEARLKPLVLFHYHPSRGQEVPEAVLAGFQGYLQTDGLASYNKAGSMPGVIHVGCTAHVRRYFFDASKITKKTGSADQALAFIAKVYVIERRLRAELEKGAISREQFVTQRRAEAGPVWEKFHAWLLERSSEVAPKSALGTAITYALTEWPKVIRYLDAWFLTPDNNAAEQSIRPYVIGRNSWLFSDTQRGAHASATLYSLVVSARSNGLEPYHYLRYLFDRLPAATTRNDLMALLPTIVTPDQLLVR